MKNKFTILITALIIAMPTFSQTKTAKESNLEAHIIALEKAGWNAWKNKDVAWFRANTTEECLWVNADGISNKEQMMKSTLTDCEVSGIVPNDFNFVILNENTVLLMYNVLQDAVCNGEKIPSKIRAAVNYVKRDGKWLEAFYMETTMVK